MSEQVTLSFTYLEVFVEKLFRLISDVIRILELPYLFFWKEAGLCCQPTATKTPDLVVLTWTSYQNDDHFRATRSRITTVYNGI